MSRSKFFFAGEDNESHGGLWVSDGTDSGTSEIGGVGDAGVSGVSSGGFQSNYVASFGDGVLFQGADSSGGYGIWFSDGTTSGTYEIGGLGDSAIAGAGTHGLGFDMLGNFVSLGSKALFNAEDSSGVYGLFVTDGTSAGTFELGGLKNAGLGTTYFAGLADSLGTGSYTVFGDKVLFGGTDSDDFEGIWVCDGTNAGTFELGGLKSGGLSSSGGPLLYSAALSGSRAVFEWSDGADEGLWVTDGTTAGTSEIGGAGNKGIANVDAGLLVQGPLVSFNGMVLFAGGDSNYYTGLWITNGTSGGTYEIGGLSSAAIANASPASLYPRDITVFGSEAVFEARDAQGDYGLWITDGTASGTSEVGGLESLGIANAGANFAPSDFTVIGNKVLFDATDASGQTTLWVTDGTASGTQEIGGLDNHGVTGAPSGGLVALATHTGQAGQNGAFTSNGTYASFSAYGSSGGIGLWVSDGTVAGTYEISGVSGQGWQPAGPRDIVAGPPVPAPSVAITSASLQSNQTTVQLAGTIDVSDASETITIHDGSTQVGTASASSSGAWSATVTVSSKGTHALTAQATNGGGTGTSNAVTDLVGSSTATLTTGVQIVLFSGSGGAVTLRACQAIGESGWGGKA